MEENRIIKSVLNWHPTGRRKKGRPTKLWWNGIQKAMEGEDLEEYQWLGRTTWMLESESCQHERSIHTHKNKYEKYTLFILVLRKFSYHIQAYTPMMLRLHMHYGLCEIRIGCFSFALRNSSCRGFFKLFQNNEFLVSLSLSCYLT